MKKIALSALGAAVATSFVYAADEEKTKSNEGIEEVVVYGEQFDRSLKDTHTSVSVELGKDLDVNADKDLFDVVDRLPGVNAQGGGFGFVIRGIADSGVAGGGAQAINIQVDGAAVPNGQALYTGAMSVWDLEQVEVLRGPQSTQQGQNALAGAIILRSRQPVFENQFKVRADSGSFNETRAAMAVNLPLNDQWAFRLAAEDYRSDGDIAHHQTGEDTADEFLKTYRAKLRFRPNDQLDMVVSHTNSENRLGVQSIMQSEFPQRRVQAQLNNQEGTTKITGLSVKYRIDDAWSVSSETSYLDSDYVLDFPIESLNPLNTPALRTVDDVAVSEELKFQYLGDSFRWTGGLYYRETEKALFFNAIIPDASIYGFPPGSSARFGNTLDEEITNYALFSEAEYDISDKWTAIAALRYDKEEQESVSANFSVFDPEPFPGANADPTPVNLEASYNALLPKLALIYRWSEDLSGGFTVQRGYRAGGSATDLISRQQYEYDPEYTTNYELSLRSISLDGRLSLSANVFYTDYEDMQLNIPGPSGTFLDATIANAGAATLKGVEMESSYDITDQLNVYLNVGYTDTELKEYVVADADDNPVSLAGNEFSQAPRLTGSVGGAYNFNNGFNIELNGAFTDKSYYTINNDPAELNRAFFLVNARVGYTSDSFWSAHFYARNLTDKQYLSRRRADGFGTAGDSRVIGISLNANF